MFEALFFVIGFLLGGMFGVGIMCLLQFSRMQEDKEDRGQ